MAIAALDFERVEEDGAPALQLVARRAPTYQVGRNVGVRRAARQRMLARRRRALIVAAVIVSVVILAWPGHAFGGETGLGGPIDAASGAALSAGMVYVVQPHDTVMTIARLVDPWDPTVARRALVRELGSDVVVPGEHVLVP
jgi:hypothetical protein